VRHIIKEIKKFVQFKLLLSKIHGKFLDYQWSAVIVYLVSG